MSKLLITFLVFLSFQIFAAEHAIKVLISFSMPEQLLKEVLIESTHLKIPAILNGLYNNSMPQTLTKVFEFTKEIPNLNLQIDPTVFERFAVKQVPALIVEGKTDFDILYGNLALRKGLEKIAEFGNSNFSMEEIKDLTGE